MAQFPANIDLSSLDGSNGFKLSGAAQRDYSGYSVASAGDVNGDGFADLIIGAHGADPHGGGSGASYVVLGKATGFGANLDLSSLDGSNGFRLSGVAAGDKSGHSVASAGDVNGDGFSDLIVGAPYAESHGDRSGASYVIYGRAPDTAVDRTGTVASQTLAGGAFDDTLSGLGGDDRLFGHGAHDTLEGGTGDDVARGGAGNDRLYSGSGTDDLYGDSGDDRFFVGATLTAQDLVAGGGGSDTLVLAGDYANLVFGATTMADVETILLTAGSSYKLTTYDATLQNDTTLSVEAGNLGPGETLDFDGSAETGAASRFIIVSGKGSDTLGGGAGGDFMRAGSGRDALFGYAGDDHLEGGLDDDVINLGSGVDTVGYGDVLDSTSRNYDTIVGFNANVEHFDLPVAISGVDAIIASGRLSEANLNDDLAAAANAARLLANHAVLFTPDQGAHAGETFLIADANGVAGYQAREDFVFRLDNPSNLGSLSTSTFV